MFKNWTKKLRITVKSVRNPKRRHYHAHRLRSVFLSWIFIRYIQTRNDYRGLGEARENNEYAKTCEMSEAENEAKWRLFSLYPRKIFAFVGSSTEIPYLYTELTVLYLSVSSRLGTLSSSQTSHDSESINDFRQHLQTVRLRDGVTSVGNAVVKETILVASWLFELVRKKSSHQKTKRARVSLFVYSLRGLFLKKNR